MMDDLAPASLVGLAAFVGGLVFGAVVQRTHFCTMGALADLVLFQDWRRMRAWLLAMAVALLSSQALEAAGIVDLGATSYRSGALHWLGALLGGLLFGFGMTLAGGCASRNLVRLGAGNLKSLFVLLVMGVVGYMTMNGLLALPRLQLEAVGSVAMSDQGLPRLLGLGSALPMTLALGGILLYFCLKDKKFRDSPRDLIAGLMIGALIPVGWLITGVVGADDFEPVSLTSFTFVAPVGRGLVYLMTFPSAAISFGVAAIGGVVAGAFLTARWAGDFRVEGFADIGDLRRHLRGAALMGFGGVLGLGCTIGQGVTGLSTMAAGSFLTLAAIMTGGVLGVRYLESGSLLDATRALLSSLSLRRSSG